MWPALPKVEQMTDNKREGGAGLSPIEDVIADAAAGKLFILVDDEDRENEGDLCVLGEWATADSINFMAKIWPRVDLPRAHTFTYRGAWPFAHGASQ